MQAWLVVALCVLTVETTLRAFPAKTTSAIDPGIRFFWPDWVYFKLNNFGHRDRDFATYKPADVYRILLLGDSMTEGAGLTRAQTFGQLAESKLNRRLAGRGKVEVYNLGHSGLNTREEVDILLRDGPQLKPDLVVLNYVVNDAETRPPTIAAYNTPEWLGRIHNVFFTQLPSYAYYRFFLRVSFFPSNFESSIALWMAEHDENEQGWRDVVAALDRMSDWLSQRQLPSFALIWPIPVDDWPQQAKELFQQVETALTMRGLKTLDLTAHLVATGRPLSEYSFSEWDRHLNAEGNRQVADLLSETVWMAPSFQAFTRRAKSGGE